MLSIFVWTVDFWLDMDNGYRQENDILAMWTWMIDTDYSRYMLYSRYKLFSIFSRKGGSMCYWGIGEMYLGLRYTFVFFIL